MPLARTSRGSVSLPDGSNSNPSVTSASFTPAAGALLVVLGAGYASGGSGNWGITMSSTFTGQGSWTVRSVTRDDGFTNIMGSFIAWSVCGASPGTGTVKWTGVAGTITGSMHMHTVEVTGQAASPEAQQVTNSGTGASLATNFAATPAATSYCFFTAIDGSSTLTKPSGTTSLSTATVSGGGWIGEHAEKLGSAAQNNSWTTGSFCSTAVAMEIAEALGQPTGKRLGGIPHAGGAARGRW